MHHHLGKNNILNACPTPFGASIITKHIPSKDLHFVSVGPLPLPRLETVP